VTAGDLRSFGPFVEPSGTASLSSNGLWRAAHRIGFGVVIPFIVLMGGYTVVRMIGDVVLWSAIIAGLSAATVILAMRRSEYLVWAMYLQGLNVFAFLWERADDAGMPLQLHYALAADRAIGLGVAPTVWLQEHMYTAGNVGVHDWVFTAVYTSFFVGPALTLLVLWQCARGLARQFVMALLATLFLGLAVIALVPTAPPWMASEQGLIPPVHRVVQDAFAVINDSAYDEGKDVVGENEVAAMPSIHMAVAVVIAATIGRGSQRRRRWWPALYPAAMGFALVYLGEHYVVDIIAGVATAVVGWRVAHFILARGRRAAIAELAPQQAVAAREAA
jgi:membrane-associated phospholipid phosphatase